MVSKKMRSRLADKLNPGRVRVSPMFHAILACLLGQAGWSRPELSALCVTSDGFVLGCVAGDVGFNQFLGAKADLDRNLAGVADCVGLTPAEKTALLSLSPAYRAA